MGLFPCLLLHSYLQQQVFAILFPDDESLVEQSRGRKDVGPEPISPCPGGEIFCEEAEDYPKGYKIDENLIAARIVRETIFDTKQSLVSRINSEIDFVKESRACDHRKSTVYPKKARNNDGAFRFIVNDEQYRQAVDIEQCLNADKPCLTDEDAPSFGKTVCRQKFATYKMYVINEEGEQVYDSFSLPSACLCHHKSNFAIRNDLKSDPGLGLPFCPKAEKLSIPSISIPILEESNIEVEKTTKSSAVVFGRKKRQAEVELQTESCESNKKNYCTDNAYPKEVELGIFKLMKGTKEITSELFQQLYDAKCRDIKGRFFDVDEEQLCYGIPKIIRPQKAKNLDDKWQWIVNIDNYTQTVEIEECHNFNEYEDTVTSNDTVQFEEQTTFDEFGSCLYSGSEGNNPDLTVCRQLYTEHKLLALSDEGQLIVDSFKLPSACACFVRKDLILEFRNGNMQESEEPTLPPQVEDAGEILQFQG